MAKKVNPFAGDFQNITKSADDKVMKFLQQEEAEKEKTQTKPETTSKKIVTEQDKSETPTETNEKPKAPKLKVAAKGDSKPKPVKVKAEEWGKPIALFNTRIPEKMAELLDDLAYRRKKQGLPCTKQAIAIEALESYLQKEGVLKSA